MKSIFNFIQEKLVLNQNSNSGNIPYDKKRDDPSLWEVGDIICGTWGYSMCFPAWYKIIKRTAKMFTVQEIPGKIIKGSRNGQWEEIADIEAPAKGKEIRARINKHGSVKVDSTYVHLWDGETPLHGDDMN